MKINKVERSESAADPRGQVHKVEIGWVYGPNMSPGGGAMAAARFAVCGTCGYQKNVVFGDGTKLARAHLVQEHQAANPPGFGAPGRADHRAGDGSRQRHAGGQPSYETAVRLVREGRVTEARQMLRAVVDADPAHLEARFQLGVAEYRCGDPGSAEQHLAVVVGRDRDHLWGWYYRGVVLAELGRREDAVSALLEALRLNLSFEKALATLEELSVPRARALELARGIAETGNTTGAAPPSPSRDAGHTEEAITPGDPVWQGRRRYVSFWVSDHYLPWSAMKSTQRATTILAIVTAVPIAVLLSHLWLEGQGWTAIATVVALVGGYVALAALYLVVYSAQSWYVIRPRRIDIREGVFIRKELSVWLYDVVDVKYRQNIIQKLFREATIELVLEAKQQAAQPVESIRLSGIFGDDWKTRNADMHRLFTELRDNRPTARHPVRGVFT